MKHVLLVDDIQVNLDILEKMFQLYVDDEVKLHMANSVKEALLIHDQLVNNGYAVDLIISDLQMPELSGEDLFHSLDRANIFKGKFVFLTGFEDFKKEGADVYYKPLTKKKLNEIVDGVL
jgi:YesN/AraC family two-component response regulator